MTRRPAPPALLGVTVAVGLLVTGFTHITCNPPIAPVGAAATSAATITSPATKVHTLTKPKRKKRARAVLATAGPTRISLTPVKACRNATTRTTAAGTRTARATTPQTFTSNKPVTITVTGPCRITITITATPTPDTVASSPSPEVSPSIPTPSNTPEPEPQNPSDATSVLAYGAVGDGVTDDTAALQRGLDATHAGAALLLPAGKTFKHSGVLYLRQAGQIVTGGGVLLASNEATSNVAITANAVTLSHVTLRMGVTTKRWETYEQMKLRLGPVSGVTLSDVTVDGAAAAGIYVGGASHFTFNQLTVQNTRADAIHFTESSHDGTLTDATITNPGDDGVAVVSYAAGDVPAVQNITITNPKLYRQAWGRGFSVVGGTNITWNNIYSEHSNAATIYIAAEGEYNTQAVSNVTFDGGTINYANDNAAVDHGAIMLYNSKAGAVNTDIAIKNIAINNTRTGWAQIQINNAHGGVQQRLTLNNLSFTNGPALFPYGVPASGYSRTGWTYNNAPVANIG